MKSTKLLLFLAAAGGICLPAHDRGNAEAARWEQEARNTTIVRDVWGIAHIYGRITIIPLNEETDMFWGIFRLANLVMHRWIR